MIQGHATSEGTARFAKRHPALHSDHWQPAGDLTLSSLGIGTYLGNPDERDDARYAEAIHRAMARGINVIDTAINYRFQRSERSIRTALERALKDGVTTREEIFLSTKGGYISGDGAAPNREWFERTFIRPGIATPKDLAAGHHCMTPAYLRHEVDQSLRNLGVATIDLYYVHNPETQIPEVGPDEFYRRLTEAFRTLEALVREEKIVSYGTATWNAYRVPNGQPNHLSLRRVIRSAQEAGGEKHHFRAIQLPFNPALPEASSEPTQPGNGGDVTALEAAREANLLVFTSASLFQGQLLGKIRKDARTKFSGIDTDAQYCLQIARSTPGICTALCGMKDVRHVEENSKIAALPLLSDEEYRSLLTT